MSQDGIRCAKCGELCGYDGDKAYWEGHNLALCGICKMNLASKFCAFFGIETSWTNMGVEIEWGYVDKILSNIKRDVCRRESYIVTDKIWYERTQKIPVSILE